MNIQKAKETIKDTVRLYLKKDAFGEYCIPIVRQRPIFLLGAPGIGKTAIMEQIAGELGIAIVSYSMTHHTRQSALGLPKIEERTYKDEHFPVTEYTMSEILASIYTVMEESGVEEGILFLDEVNCVSETLSPSMLQFLQTKKFGGHKVPDGWIIVTAGNPPMYNRSVREFDVVTLDRLKVMEAEADYATWKKYGKNQGIHGAILGFLDGRSELFYALETAAGGKEYVTPRGWEDLSAILALYEEEKLEVDEELIYQYLHHKKIAREFSSYYDLYQRYKEDYRVTEILKGTFSGQTVEKASAAPFDEKISLLGMLMDYVRTGISSAMELVDVCSALKPMVKSILSLEESELSQRVSLLLSSTKEQLARTQASGALLTKDARVMKSKIAFLMRAEKGALSGEQIKEQFVLLTGEAKKQAIEVSASIDHVFSFSEKAFSEHEILLAVTELTAGEESARFLATFGNESYTRFSEKLMMEERSDNLLAKVSALDLDEI